MESFKNKTAKVIVVDGSSSTRQMMSSALRGLGFTNTMAVTSLTEALTVLAKDPQDWLITSLFPDEKVNALHVIALARQHDEIKDLKVSLLVGEAEDGFLSRAFSLGLLSSHRKSFTKAEFSDGVEGVLKTAEREKWNDVLTAAVYLRNHLLAKEAREALLAFESTLVEKFPQEASLLVSLAEAYFVAGDVERASALLWQAEQREPELADQALAVAEKYLGMESESSRGGLRPGVCVIIEPDIAAQLNAKEVLEACAAKEIHTFADGEAAWEWLKSHEPPDLIIMEWRIPKVTGPMLLQRLRSHGMHLPLVMVNSSLVGKKDQPLLQEMGVTTVVGKPTGRNEYFNSLSYTFSQARRPTERSSLENRIRAHLAAGASDEAAALMQLYIAQSDVQDASRRHLEAEFAFHLGDYAAARELAMASLQLGGKSVITLNLLGKTLMKLSDFKAALKVFERASEISPNSVERLCSVAETQCALGDEQTATQTLDKATKLDRENQAVVNATVNIALATGNAAMASEIFDKVRPSDSVLAYINNRAVACSKAGEFAEGIALYDKALKAIPADRQGVRSVVIYNMALAQIQNGDSAGALASLKLTVDRSDPSLGPKITSLLERMEAAHKAGKPMKLNQRDAAAGIQINPAAVKFASLLKKLTPVPEGVAKTACCHGIYKDTGTADTLVNVLMDNMPRFSSWRPS